MYYSKNLLLALSLSSLTLLGSAKARAQAPAPAPVLPLTNPDLVIPPGYTEGLATQHNPNPGQKSICNTNCNPLGTPFSTTWGPQPLPPNVYSAAINGILGGAGDNCEPCGSCYSIISAGVPYCDVNDKEHLKSDPLCAKYTGPTNQVGPKEIKVLITDHCLDCDDHPGHFDINQVPNPTGWDNPKIFYKKLDYTECM